MNTITLKQAQAQLPDLIHDLKPGEEIVITENNQPVAKLVSEHSNPKPGEEIVITENYKPVAKLVSEHSNPKPGLRPPPGLGKGFITIVSDDSEHLKDFEEYMP